MFTISFSRVVHIDWSHFAASLLGLGFYRVGRVGSVEDLSDHLRRDLGLAERGPGRQIRPGLRH